MLFIPSTLIIYTVAVLIGGVFILLALHRWNNRDIGETNIDVILLGTALLGLMFAGAGSFLGSLAFKDTLRFYRLTTDNVVEIVAIDGESNENIRAETITNKVLKSAIIEGLSHCEPGDSRASNFPTTLILKFKASGDNPPAPTINFHQNPAKPNEPGNFIPISESSNSDFGAYYCDGVSSLLKKHVLPKFKE